MNHQVPQFSREPSFVKRVILALGTLTLCLCTLAIFTPGPLHRESYMGAEYCGSCHAKEYASWSKSAHARAHQSLKGEQKSDPACLSCHATAILEKNDKGLPGVQCESCHGAGQYYAALHIKKDKELSKLLFMEMPDEKSCRHCHSQDSKLWSTGQGMKKIEHWVPKAKVDNGGSFKQKMAAFH